MKILFLKGLPGSGKTTFAKEWVAEDPENRKRVNKDEIRESNPGCKESLVLSIRNKRIDDAVEYNQDIVVDDTNFNPIHEETIRKFWGKDHEIEVKYFDVDPLTCIERDSKREKPVGAKVIRDMYMQYVYKCPTGTEERGNIVLCDIDGTLAFKGDREWHEYDKVGVDYFNPVLGIILLTMFESGKEIVFLSGRKDSCRPETQVWLRNFFEGTNLEYKLLMRKADDNRDDIIVKKEIFEENFTVKDILCVFDDRPKVIQMWKQLGLYVFGCNQEPYNLPF